MDRDSLLYTQVADPVGINHDQCPDPAVKKKHDTDKDPPLKQKNRLRVRIQPPRKNQTRIRPSKNTQIRHNSDPQPSFILYCYYCIAGSIIPPGDEFADVHERVKYFCGVTNEELLEKLRLGFDCAAGRFLLMQCYMRLRTLSGFIYRHLET